MIKRTLHYELRKEVRCNRRRRIDRTNGALVANWVKVLELAAAEHNNDTAYIFGHAGSNHPVTGRRADLMYFRDYLTALLEHTRAGAQLASASRVQKVGRQGVVAKAKGRPRQHMFHRLTRPPGCC